MNKKGVSPLVATILLIAFAVSIGAVIMNWTATAQGVSTNSGVCEEVKIAVLSSENAFCLDRDAREIILNIENGPVRIDGVRFSYSGTSSRFQDIDGVIEPAVLQRITVAYNPSVEGEPQSVKVVPYVMQTDKVFCNERGISMSQIPDCR
ncbi:MAG: archaellin/type IV pilin N-terminal domain-containing protein [Candidatus Woesearchaeota archaeon]